MKKISQVQWKRYKDSAEGKEAISLFEKLGTPETSPEEMIKVAEKFDPAFFRNLSQKDINYLIECIVFYNNKIADLLESENVEVKTTQDCLQIYMWLLDVSINDNPDLSFEEIPQKNFKAVLGENIAMSLALYNIFGCFFIPNFFVMQFIFLQKLAKKYDLELPEAPKRTDYRERCLYYYDICAIFNHFLMENGFETIAELCAFVYDYEFPQIQEELENEDDDEMPEVPQQAWLLVGNYGEGEKDMSYGFWQANELTEKGDLMLFYEKSPVKAMNSMWIAQQYGVVDPFFHYYSNTYIGQKIEIPEKYALTFQDFKNSEYFQSKGSKGNFVSKNFQDCSGWAVSREDYAEILRMLKAKGLDTSILPRLYEPKKIGNVEIKLEKDVSEQLLIPLLERMGWANGVDFKGEVEFNAGRTKTNHSSDKRPDFLLHITETADDIEAKVAFEVKKFMKNGKEIEANFIQGRSYAKWGNVQVLVLCDESQIRVYPRNRHGRFEQDEFVKFSWNDMENGDKFIELKRLLS